MSNYPSKAEHSISNQLRVVVDENECDTSPISGILDRLFSSEGGLI